MKKKRLRKKLRKKLETKTQPIMEQLMENMRKANVQPAPDIEDYLQSSFRLLRRIYPKAA